MQNKYVNQLDPIIIWHGLSINETSQVPLLEFPKTLFKNGWL